MTRQNSDDLFFEISGEDNCIRLEPESLLHPNTEDEYDRSWIYTKVRVRARALSGEFYANLMTIDFERLKRQFRNLDKHFNSPLDFKPLEGQILMSTIHDGQGHFKLDCKVFPDISFDCNLSFIVNFDQTEIIKCIIQLERITQRFPMEECFKLED